MSNYQNSQDAIKALKEVYESYEWPTSDGGIVVPEKNPYIKPPVCECGAAKCGYDSHSTWCPLAEGNK